MMTTVLRFSIMFVFLMTFVACSPERPDGQGETSVGSSQGSSFVPSDLGFGNFSITGPVEAIQRLKRVRTYVGKELKLSTQLQINTELGVEFHWYKDGVPMPEQKNQLSYFVDQARLDNAGTYFFEVLEIGPGGVKTVYQDSVVVEVRPENEIPTAASITQPTEPGNATARVGSNISFRVSVVGSPMPRIQWMKDGVDLTGETDPSLMIPFVVVSDAGVYSARVSNEVSGETVSVVSMPTTLIVQVPLDDQGTPIPAGEPGNPTEIPDDDDLPNTIGSKNAPTPRVSSYNNATMTFRWTQMSEALFYKVYVNGTYRETVSVTDGLRYSVGHGSMAKGSVLSFSIVGLDVLMRESLPSGTGTWIVDRDGGADR